MKTVSVKQVDAFTTIPFGGNPAGVVTDASKIISIYLEVLR